MKKALSILLVAAAFFGFYGSVVNLNDILACKDYWEEAGEKSTADMNKLEDGLNQLKDNEQAYLDGQDQLAEGEKTLAQGEADYAAAPAQLAAGEKQLAEGQKSYSDLKKLISGLQTVRNHGVKKTKAHDKWWDDAYNEALKPGRKKIEGIVSSPAYTSLLGLIDMLNGQTPGTIIMRFSDTSQSYESFDSKVQDTKKNFEDAATLLKNYKKSLFGLGTAASGVMELAQKAATDPTTYGAAYMTALNSFGEAAAKFDDAEQGYGMLNDNVPNLPGLPEADVESLTLLMTAIEKAADGQAAASSPVPNPQDPTGETKVPWFGVIASALSGENGAKLGGTIDSYVNMLDYDDPTDENDGYAQQFGTWDDGYQTLADGKDQLASKSDGVPYAFTQMLTNSTIRSAVNKYDKKLVPLLKKYAGNRLNNDEFGDEFDKDLVDVAKNVIPRALAVLSKVKGSAEDQLADGRAQLAEGYASYAAAPAQLEAGRQALADGKAQLAEYEDGEQQIRDGLATLFNTEADLDLVSIADRLNGDGDFDNGDTHLEIDEGLNAVSVGREYQAEDGVLITKEIMARAVGTGALLGAAALAVIAAILSFLKKNKGAGVFALLAAAAGAFGAYYGPAAGTYFSDIAGSTAGSAAWMAAGAVGVVALIHAIVHFAAPKTAA